MGLDGGGEPAQVKGRKELDHKEHLFCVKKLIH
jgi:hypothetical protein